MRAPSFCWSGDQGFKSLADYVHGKGLLSGIHIMRGIPREEVDKNLPIEGLPFTPPISPTR